MTVRRLLVAAATLGALALVPPTAASAAPATDSGQIVFSTGGALVERDLAAGTESTLFTCSGDYGCTDVAWSPDGSQVAFSSADRGWSSSYASHIWVVDRATRTARQLTTGDVVDRHPAWSPDGRTVAFDRVEPSVATTWLYTVPSGGGAATQMVNGGNASSPSYAPSGDRLVFARGLQFTRPVLELMNLDGTGRMELGVAGEEPAWSPDGRWIAFVDSSSAVSVVDPRGTNRRNLVNTGEWVTAPSWSSDSASLFLVRYVPELKNPGYGDVQRLDLSGVVTAVTNTPSVVEQSVSYRATRPPADMEAPTLGAITTRFASGGVIRMSWPALTGDAVGVRFGFVRGTTPPAAPEETDRQAWHFGPAATHAFEQFRDLDRYDNPGTWSWAAQAYDAWGNRSQVRTGTFRAISPPYLSWSRFTPITSPGTTAPTVAFPVRVSVGAGSTTTVEWAQRVRTSTGWVSTAFRPWFTTGGSRLAVFGSGGSPRTVQQGTTYRLRAVADDGYGNKSPSETVDTTVPYDDRNPILRYGGSWQRTASNGRWLSTVTSTVRAGASLTIRTEGSHFAVIGDKLPSTGSFKVYLDGKYVQTVSTYSRTAQARQLLYWTRWLPGGVRPHTLTLVNAASAGHPYVRIDAVAAGR
jgi:hypothetical protein